MAAVALPWLGAATAGPLAPLQQAVSAAGPLRCNAAATTSGAWRAPERSQRGFAEPAVGGAVPRQLRRAASASTGATTAQPCVPAALIDELLTLVAGTDRGAATSPTVRERAAALIEELERCGMPEPLQSPLIFGEWDVVYTSSPTAAGGGYRSAAGRLLLRFHELVQGIAPPDRVTNRVSFAVLGLLQCAVVLQGKFEGEDSRWVKVDFEPPQLTLGPLHFTYARTSTVRLSTTYLDERLRLGRGSRGSVFVFARRPALEV
eukprot:SM000039S14478  [mRNA]  locus=s39:348514:349899:- [translate_table: standard]